MANPHEMGDLIYQFTVTGETAVQVSRCEQRLVKVLTENWVEVHGCCGLVSVSRQGIVRIEDRLYQSVVSATLKETSA